MSFRDGTILLAEDDQNDVFFLKRALKKNNIGNPVQVVKDGEEAIDYLAGNGQFADRTLFPHPAFIILDLKMPRKSGFEVLEWLKSNPEHQVVPTLVLSSSAQPEDVLRAYDLGANSFMVKQSSFENMERMVKTIHEYWSFCQTLDWARRN